ncbi:hypothetical protein WCE55_05020 [Luteimonas sp. MJ293]|uniref:hypothetical protein n=1 Tax=Luteimonas sp. MJ146 TaxID=3129240 RepID=UPI0031BBC783
MKKSLLLLVLLMAPHSTLATTCVFVPLEQRLDEANIAFIATITEATSSASFGTLETGDEYRVNYNFEVRERLKGEPTVVPSLFTRNIYHAHDSGLSFDGDETRLLPGDNVLVLASSPGEAQVASCAPSRIWSPTREQLQLLPSPGSAL